MKYKIGDKVECLADNLHLIDVGVRGVIASLSEPGYLVDFPGNDGHYMLGKELKLVEKMEYKIGDRVEYVGNDDGQYQDKRNIGLVGIVVKDSICNTTNIKLDTRVENEIYTVNLKLIEKPEPIYVISDVNELVELACAFGSSSAVSRQRSWQTIFSEHPETYPNASGGNERYRKIRDAAFEAVKKLPKEPEKPKWSEKELEAIRESIIHWKDNLLQLLRWDKAGEKIGWGPGLAWSVVDSDVRVYATAGGCSLCILTEGKCADCPLSKVGKCCRDDGSLWKECGKAEVNKNIISAAEGMLKALEELL